MLLVKPQAILFDLDGTLVDSVPDLTMALRGAFAELDLPEPVEAQVREWVGNGALALVQRGLAWAKKLDVSAVDSAELNQLYTAFLQHYRTTSGIYSRLYQGVSEALAQWQRQAMPMAIVTNKPLQFVPKLLADLGIADYFSVLIGGECVAERKPSPTMLFHACEQLQFKPEMCLMVGDSRNDVEAARAAMMPVVAVDYGYNYDRPVAEECPDLVVSSLTELLDGAYWHE
ncbi:MAG: phosphoglycolate phosphatase [Spongiibacteraceae bacterium]